MEASTQQDTPRRRRQAARRAAAPRVATAEPNRPPTRRVMITGVSGYWGTRLALRLEQDPRYEAILGVDTRIPTAGQFRRTEFIGVDVKSPVILDILHAQRIDTVVHLALISSVDKEQVLDNNVLGTRHILAACAEVGVQKLILKSSTTVYGARADNPNYLPESWPLRARPYHPYFRSYLEVERYAAEFLGQYPDVCVNLLRFPSVLGPTADTSLTRYLHERAVPTVLGFDPLYQVLHEDDVTGAMVSAVERDVRGPVNVAADGVLYLHHIIRMAGKTPWPVITPLNYPLLNTLSALPLMPVPHIDFLRYLWVADTTRMREELGFQPAHTAVETVQDFVQSSRLHRFSGPEEPQDTGELAAAALREILENPDEEGL
jgi:UDP-glucose 4-epimerase